MIDNKILNEMVDDYLQIFNRVTATFPRTFAIKRGDDFDSAIETLELSPTDIKDIAATLFIHINRNKEREAKAKEPASPRQVNFVADMYTHPNPAIREVVTKDLEKLKKKPEDLTSEEASMILDKVKPLLQQRR